MSVDSVMLYQVQIKISLMQKTVDILTNLSLMLSVIYYFLGAACFSAPFAAYLLSLFAMPAQRCSIWLEKIVQAFTFSIPILYMVLRLI